jgi:DNA-binding XRE family transcriptional regulator
MSRDFGVWMKVMRAERNWNQSRLAKKVGVHLNTIIRWESGTQFPTLDMAEKIFEVFGWELTAIREKGNDTKATK